MYRFKCIFQSMAIAYTIQKYNQDFLRQRHFILSYGRIRGEHFKPLNSLKSVKFDNRITYCVFIKTFTLLGFYKSSSLITPR